MAPLPRKQGFCSRSDRCLCWRRPWLTPAFYLHKMESYNLRSQPSSLVTAWHTIRQPGRSGPFGARHLALLSAWGVDRREPLAFSSTYLSWQDGVPVYQLSVCGLAPLWGLLTARSILAHPRQNGFRLGLRPEFVLSTNESWHRFGNAGAGERRRLARPAPRFGEAAIKRGRSLLSQPTASLSPRNPSCSRSQLPLLLRAYDSRASCCTHKTLVRLSELRGLQRSIQD